MTEQDKRYRQGRSFKQREAQYKFMEFLGALVVVMVFVFLMFSPANQERSHHEEAPMRARLEVQDTHDSGDAEVVHRCEGPPPVP